MTAPERQYITDLWLHIITVISLNSRFPEDNDRYLEWLTHLSVLRIKEVGDRNRGPVTRLETWNPVSVGGMLFCSFFGGEIWVPITDSDYTVLNFDFFNLTVHEQIRILIHESYHAGTGYNYGGDKDLADFWEQYIYDLIFGQTYARKFGVAFAKNHQVLY